MMKEFQSKDLRNVVFLGHGNCGKTSLLDDALFHTGTAKRRGSVDDGTSLLDASPEEQERHLTMEAKLAACEWGDCKLNLLDTPGYPDFVGEAIEAMNAADAAVIVVSAHSGIEVETEKFWNLAKEQELPRMFFLNKMDREHTDFHGVVDELRVRFGSGVVPVQLPIGQEAAFQGVVDLLKMHGKIVPHDEDDCVVTDIPEYLDNDVEMARQTLIEAVADYNNELLEKYLEGEEISEDEVGEALRKGIADGKLFPVFCGSAKADIGVKKLLNGIAAYLPSPADRTVIGTVPGSEELVERAVGDAFSAYAWKTTVDPLAGRQTYLRIYSGKLKADTSVLDVTTGRTERIGALQTLHGKQAHSVAVAHAGDIVVTSKLANVQTGDTLADTAHPIAYEAAAFPTPMLEMAVHPKKKGEEDKLFAAIAKCEEADPTLAMRKEAGTKETILAGIGEMQLKILEEKLESKYHVGLTLAKPRIAYRETIKKATKAEGKYKKQSGGHGQYGHVLLEITPQKAGEGNEFTETIFGGSVPRQFIPAVEKGTQETLANGILAGYPVVDVKVNLYDGSYHPVDSSEASFKSATAIALKKGVLDASPVLLEPIDTVTVAAPEYYVGGIIGSLNSKRARILGTETGDKGQMVVRAEVPEAELYQYATDLRSQTQGRGTYEREFLRYEVVPEKQAAAVIEEAKAAK